MSAKRTVTSLRSSAARSASAVPQAGQKRAPSGTEVEHLGHASPIATVEAYIGIWLRSIRREMNPRSPSYRSMPLSAIQKGAVGQFAFLATALVTGRGQVEVYTPAADNEGRDAEVRRHLRRAASIGIQIKVAFGLHHVTGHHGRTYLEHRFVTPEKRLRNDPRLWYFVAVYDLRQLRYLDPVFLIPSAVMHRLARCGRATRGIQFEVIANLLPTSRDKWSPYRVALSDLGKRLLEIIDEAPLKATADVPTLTVEGVWLSRIGARSARRVRSVRADRKYSLIRKAVLQRDSVSAWYNGHRRLFSPVLLGSKAGDQHVLGYQFAGTSEKPLAPDGSPENWRCLRVLDLTRVKVMPGVWHAVKKGHGFQNCIDQVDVSAYRPTARRRQLRLAA